MIDVDLLKNIADMVLGAKDAVVEKNRKTALINRLRAVVKCDEQAAERAYIALGRYYYHNLRDASNSITEASCTDIDAAEKRIEQAAAHLDKIYGESDEIAEKIDLDDVTELSPTNLDILDGAGEVGDCASEFNPDLEDTAVEGVLDEAVPPAVQEASQEDKKDEEIPFEG